MELRIKFHGLSEKETNEKINLMKDRWKNILKKLCKKENKKGRSAKNQKRKIFENNMFQKYQRIQRLNVIEAIMKGEILIIIIEI